MLGTGDMHLGPIFSVCESIDHTRASHGGTQMEELCGVRGVRVLRRDEGNQGEGAVLEF